MDAKREAARIVRKKALAETQAASFEDTLSGHELNLARLEAYPEEERDQEWHRQHDDEVKSINILKRAIETTLKESQ